MCLAGTAVNANHYHYQETIFNVANGKSWLTIIFGGLVPAVLGITGLLMWLRGRRARHRLAEAEPLPAA
jgi:hypothetical protein